MPIISRGSMFKKLKELFSKSEYYDDEQLKVSKHTQERFYILLREKAALQETVEGNFYNLMENSHMSWNSYIKALGDIDSELPGKNPSQFDCLMDYIWSLVSSYTIDFCSALDTLCSAFPSYERVILKSAYLSFMYGEMDMDGDFATLIERMADFDEIEGVDHFSSDIDELLPPELNEPVINIIDNVEEIFGMLDIGAPIANIIWILENRFGIDRTYLEQKAYDEICEIFSEYSCDELIRDRVFDEIFKLPDGYNLFLLLIPNIVRNNLSYSGIRTLLRDYDINIDVFARQVEPEEEIEM